MIKIGIIIGSTRPGRSGDKVGKADHYKKKEIIPRQLGEGFII